MGVRREPAAGPGVGELLAEPVELVTAETALEERPRIDAGGSVALEVDLVCATLSLMAAKEVVLPYLVQRRS